MNHTTKKTTFTPKRVFVLALTLVFALSGLLFTPNRVQAAGQFSGAGFEVEFILTSTWSNGYNGRIIITNTSGEPIRNWALRVDANLGVQNWQWGISNGGRITAQDDNHTMITHHGWNSTLAAGSTTTLYIANGTHTGQPPNPTAFVLTGTGFESGTNGGAPAPGETEDEDEDEDDEDEDVTEDEEDEDAEEPDEEDEDDEDDEDENGDEDLDEDDEDENGDEDLDEDDEDENGDEDLDDENGDEDLDEEDESNDEDLDEDDDENGDDESDEDYTDDEDDDTNDYEDAEAAAALILPAHDGPHVLIDGVPVMFDGQPPAVIGGRTLVPVRAVFETLGFNVDWNAATQTITLERSDHVLRLTIGSDIFYIDGAPNRLDVPAQVIRGSTMLPIRPLLESVGYDVDWDAGLRAVIITR